MKKVLTVFVCCAWLVTCVSQGKYEKRFAAIDSLGNVLFEFYAKSAYAYKDGLARVRKYVVEGDKAYYRYGAINEQGVLVVSANWDKLRDFTFNVSFARKPNEKVYRLINKSGKELAGRKFEHPGYFFEGLAKFKEGSKYGFIDTAGAVVIDPKYVGVSYCSEGLICVCESEMESKYFFIDRSGAKAFEGEFSQAGTSSFKNGMARVQISGKTGLIDREGVVVVEPMFATVSGFGDSLLTVSQGKVYDKFGYANFKGEMVISGPYHSADSFKNGYASVRNDDMKAAIINKKGETIIPFEYDAVYNKLVEDGYFSAYIGNDWFYFNEQGAPFTDVPFSRLMAKGDGQLIPYQDKVSKKWGYLNLDGKVAIKAEYTKCLAFGENGIGIVQTSK